MSHGLPEQIHVVKFSSNGIERFIIGKIIRKTDLVKLVDDQGINRTPHITGFENFAGDGNDYRIITSEGNIGPLITKGGANDTNFHFGNVVGIGSREIMLAPSPAVVAAPAPAAPSSGRSWGAPGAPTIMGSAAPAPAAAAASARDTVKVSWGSPGAPKIMDAGKKTRHRRINRRRKSQNKVNAMK